MMNYSNIKMFFFDNDSTLFDHNIGNVRPSTLEGLRQLKQNGYKLCLNTSRSYEEMYNIPSEALDLMDCLILLNGAYVVKDGKVKVTYFNQEHIAKAIAYNEEHHITYRYCTDDGGGYLNNDDDKKEIFYRLYKMRPPIKKYEGEKVIHMLSYTTGKLVDGLLNILNEEENSLLGVVVESSPTTCNKGLSMLRVAKEYGFDREQLCAFGDSANDRQMLELAGLGIAMGNYQKGLEEVADYITDDISDEGLYNALKHFEFI